MRYSIFIGRFQPLHGGHVALIRSVLDECKPVLVMLRETGVNIDNPYSSSQRIAMFREAFPEFGTSLVVMALPVDVGEVCYGREVGYDIREIRLAADTEAISGTAIRDGDCLPDMLDEEREPTPALLRAGRRHKRLVGERQTREG